MNDRGEVNGIDIIDGRAPESLYCGRSDLGVVARAHLGIQDGTIYLIATYDNGNYSQSFSYQHPAKGNYGYYIIANVDSNGGITQIFKEEVVYFGSRYII